MCVASGWAVVQWDADGGDCPLYGMYGNLQVSWRWCVYVVWRAPTLGMSVSCKHSDQEKRSERVKSITRPIGGH